MKIKLFGLALLLGSSFAAAQTASAPAENGAAAHPRGALQASTAPDKSTGLDKIAAYAGTWKLEAEHFDTPFSKASKESTTIRNECWRSAGFYACDQFVNGDSKALIVFTYDAAKNVYATYPVPADGSKAGSGKLLIEGDTWTFPWQDEDGGKPVYFRVVNVWKSPDTIEYRQEFSRDNAQWTQTAKGTEHRAR